MRFFCSIQGPRTFTMMEKVTNSLTMPKAQSQMVFAVSQTSIFFIQLCILTLGKGFGLLHVSEAILLAKNQ